MQRIKNGFGVKITKYTFKITFNEFDSVKFIVLKCDASQPTNGSIAI